MQTLLVEREYSSVCVQVKDDWTRLPSDSLFPVIGDSFFVYCAPPVVVVDELMKNGEDSIVWALRHASPPRPPTLFSHNNRSTSSSLSFWSKTIPSVIQDSFFSTMGCERRMKEDDEKDVVSAQQRVVCIL